MEGILLKDEPVSFDTVVIGGEVISGAGTRRIDLGIRGGRVVAVAEPGVGIEGRATVDANGLLVVPGALDVHFHTGDTIGTGVSFADSIATATRAAACGGVTTVVPYVWGRSGESYADLVDRYVDDFRRQSFLDFGLHAGVRPDMGLIRGLPAAFERGVTSFKFHMDYRKTSVNRMTDDDHRLAAMRIIGENGGLAMFHAESGYMIDALEDYFIERGDTSWEYFLKSRPAETEVHAIMTALTIGRLVQCRIYIPHLSSRQGLQAIGEARAKGQEVYMETCPQYLLLTNESLSSLGALAKVGPPLREMEDSEALWEGLRTGRIEVIASDHSAVTLDKKRASGDNIFEAVFGMPIVEEMVSLIWSAGVAGGRLTREMAVSSLSEWPARLFGLWPRKGTLDVGSDADFFLYDPRSTWTLRAAETHGAVGWTPFEGRTMEGRIVATYQRGRMLVRDGELASGGDVMFLPAYGRDRGAPTDEFHGSGRAEG